MDTILQEVIQADQKAQARVEAIRKERSTVRRDVEGQKKAIEERCQKEAEKRMDAHKQRLQKEIESVQKKKNEEYECSLQQLHKTYEEKKTKWINGIVKRCLEG